MKKRKFEIHNFYCSQCGNMIPIARNNSQQREKFHLKTLYCIKCGIEVNHIECRNDSEIYEFFHKGEKND